MLLEFDGQRPRVAASAFIAPTAVLIGDVRVADGASIWFGAVLRGDEGRIEIGARASVQDNVTIHCGPDLPTIVGDDVTVGHAAVLEGCVIEHTALVGMGAVVLNRATVGAHAVVAAGAVVPEGAVIGAGMLAAGVPAREKRPLDAQGRRMVESASGDYQRLVARYRRNGIGDRTAVVTDAGAP